MKQPSVQKALRVLEAGEAAPLVAAKLDRLSPSMLDFSKLMANATSEHWALVALDVAVDTSTPERGSDGEHAGHLRAVRAPTHLATHEGGAPVKHAAGIALAVRRRSRRRWCGDQRQRAGVTGTGRSLREL